jgi:uncharacterized protein YhfF
MPATSPISFAFGKTPAMADNRLALVIAGVKTATSSPASDYGPDDPDRPAVGLRRIVLDGAGRAGAVIETAGVTIRRFDEVDDAHAIAEGYASLAAWRGVHDADYLRDGAPAPDALVVCEYFRLVEVLPREGGVD